MKCIHPLVLLLLGSTLLLATAAGPQMVTVKAAKKTIDSKTTNRREGRTQVSKSVREVTYEFTVSSRQPGTLSNLLAKYSIMIETPDGRKEVVVNGKEKFELVQNQPVKFRTKSFKLEEESRRDRSRSSSKETDVYGCGVKITDATGLLVAESYEPGKAESELRTAIDTDLGPPTAKKK